MQGADFCLQLPIALYRDAINVYVLLIGMSNLTIENDTDKNNVIRITWWITWRIISE